MLPTRRRPTTPGEMLKANLDDMEMTQATLAENSGLSIQTVNLIVNAKRAVTADTAIRLGEVFETGPEFWMNAQASVDLWDALELRKKARAGPARAPARSPSKRKASTSGTTFRKAPPPSQGDGRSSHR